MQLETSPHISFRDKTREAMEFYKDVFGGKLTLNTFKEFNASDDPREDNKIMHAELKNEKGVILMAADTPNRLEFHTGNNISISLSGEDEADLKNYFKGLSEGGTVSMPLEKAPWGDTFGMVTDKYGINWMVDIVGKHS